MLLAPGQRRPQVVLVGGQPSKPALAIGAEPHRFSLLGEVEEVVAETGTDHVTLPRCRQLLACELADCFEHPVSRLSLPSSVIEPDQRSVGKRRQELDAGRRTDSEDRTSLKSAGKRRKLAQERPLPVC